MDWIRLLGLCILTAGMVMLVRQMHPQSAALLSVAFGIMVLLAVLPGLKECAQAIEGFMKSTSLDEEYSRLMIKALGIVLLTQAASGICRELEASGVAKYAEFCGRIALLGVVVPVFISLSQMAIDMLK